MKNQPRLSRPRRYLASLIHSGTLLAALSASAAPGPANPPVHAPEAAAAPATSAPAEMAAPAPAVPKVTAESLRPTLPMDFSKFAADYDAKMISPPWLVVQVGTLETYYAPPSDKKAFVLPERDFRNEPQFLANYHPIELSCLMGAKAKFENVTLLDLDKAGNPLGFTVPLGQIVYFVARDETEKGIIYSLHYYDSGKSMYWVSNPDKDDHFIPVIQPLMVTEDLGAQAENYAFITLSQRIGTQRPDSTAKPLPLYTYLVIRIHKVPAPAAPTGIPSGR
jgi:hypothetical protein